MFSIKPLISTKVVLGLVETKPPVGIFQIGVFDTASATISNESEFCEAILPGSVYSVLDTAVVVVDPLSTESNVSKLEIVSKLGRPAILGKTDTGTCHDTDGPA